MKKIVIFLLCIALIFSLVSCDVSSFWSEILGATTTTQPEYETVLFQELIPKEKVRYIYFLMGLSDDSLDHIYDIDTLYELFFNDIKLTDDEDAIEAYMEKDSAFWREVYGTSHFDKNYEYSMTIEGIYGEFIAFVHLTAYNTISITIECGETSTKYVTVEANAFDRSAFTNEYINGTFDRKED